MREWSTLRKLMLLRGATGAPLKEYTATGNPLTFNTNKAKPLKSLTIPWTPTQAGSGDPSPQNVRSISGVSALNVWRTGKNLFDISVFANKQGVTIDGSMFYGYANAFNIATLDGVPFYIKKGTTLTTRAVAHRSVSDTGAGWSVYFVYADGTQVRPFYTANSVTTPTEYIGTITAEQDIVSYKIAYFNNALTGIWYVDELMFEVGSTASEYSPYTGQTYPITFPAMGRNLYDATTYPLTEDKWISSYDGGENDNTTSGYACTLGYIPCADLQGKQITLNNRPGKSVPGFAFYAQDKSFISGVGNNGAEAGLPMTLYIPNNAIFMRFTTSKSTKNETQIEKGSSATSYEPYTNTVYGGSLDLTTGVLTVEWVKAVLNDAEQWASSSGTQDFLYGISFADRKLFKTSYEGLVCSAFPVNSRLNIAYMRWASATGGKVGIKNNNTSYTLEDIQQLATNGDIAIAYMLATPQTIQLTPTEVNALLGDNVIWSDTNGSNTAVFYKKG